MPVRVRPLRGADLQAVMTLMTGELRPPLAGVQMSAVYRAVLQDALRGIGPIVHVAMDGSRAAGVSIAIPDANAYWKRLALRRPVLGALILATRKFRQPAPADGEVSAGHAEVSKHGRGIEANVVSDTPPPFEWSSPPANSVRLLYFGVSPQYRGQNIGVRLLQTLTSEAEQRGFAAVDSSVDKGNVASLRTHRRAGWELYMDRAHVYGLYRCGTEAVLSR